MNAPDPEKRNKRTNFQFTFAPLMALYLSLVASVVYAPVHADTINGHPVVLDESGKIIPWHAPASGAYDEFLRQRWNFITNSVPRLPSGHPQYYFYNGIQTTAAAITPDKAMNDIGEKIPNWFESARLYYAYTGDSNVMDIARCFIDYTIAHGSSPSNFAWPDFPHTTTRAGDTEFEGFTPNFAKHEVQLDHAGEMGLTYFRLWQFTGEANYLNHAIHVADALAANARKGTATHSVWPYRVKLDDGAIRAEYGANWIGCYSLLDSLITAGRGNTNAYVRARTLARDFILQFPMKTGYWTDGHTDNGVNSNTYKSNMSKSNVALYLFDHPEFDPDWRTHIPQLIAWTETNFVYRTTGEPATAFGAQIVGEQDAFNYKMDYQTARHAAECARWFAASGDANYREKAYRSLNWVTYCSDANGRATESPYSLNIATWWSDCYGECPRMFYHVFAAIPEWAPPGEDHILYSEGILAEVSYRPGEVRYTARDAIGAEWLRLSFKPSVVTLNNSPLAWKERPLGDGDYAVTILHQKAGPIRITGTARPPRIKPVRVAPSFVGNRNDGTQTDNIWNNGAWINACRFTADADLSVSNVYAKIVAIPGRYQCAIYDEKFRLLGATRAVKNPGAGWQTFPLTAPAAIARGQRYWLAIWSDDPNARVYAQPGGTIRWGRYDFGAWPDPLNLTDGGDMTYCIYAGNQISSGPSRVTIDGAKTCQVIDGFGVNVNHRSWRGDELKPVLDAFIDQAGMTLFRVVFDNTDWSSPSDKRLAPLWEMFAYLNARGLTNSVFFNFMGPTHQHLGGGTLAAGKEDDWAKMIADLLDYARNKQHLQFRLIAPNNEPDITNEGITMGASQYAICLRKLVEQLDARGLSDVRLVGPDLAGNDAAYRNALVADPVIMAKLAHWGVHSYNSSAGIIQDSERSCWVTEFNVWCNGCDNGQRGSYDWNYCRGTAEYLLSHLASGASGGIVWEGYDSFYLHPPSTWSFWGLFAVDNEKAAVKTYTPRKNFYTIAQITRFVRPGARRIGVTDAPLPLLAFHNKKDNRITLVGINKTDRLVELHGILASLPPVASFDLYYTTAASNLSHGPAVPIAEGTFTATIPADCVFTLDGKIEKQEANPSSRKKDTRP